MVARLGSAPRVGDFGERVLAWFVSQRLRPSLAVWGEEALGEEREEIWEQ